MMETVGEWDAGHREGQSALGLPTFSFYGGGAPALRRWREVRPFQFVNTSMCAAGALTCLQAPVLAGFQNHFGPPKPSAPPTACHVGAQARTTPPSSRLEIDTHSGPLPSSPSRIEQTFLHRRPRRRRDRIFPQLRVCLVAFFALAKAAAPRAHQGGVLGSPE